MGKLLDALNSNAVRGNNKAVIVLALTVILFFATLLLFSRAVISYNNAQSVQAENELMEKTINEWKTQVSYIKNQELRPVDKANINNVTSDILVLVQVHNLTLADFKASPITGSADKQDPFQTFSMKVTGQYADVVKFLMNFKAKDALVKIMMIDMTSMDNIITANLSYRVYIK